MLPSISHLMTFTTTMKKRLSPDEEHQLDHLDDIEFSYKKTTKNLSFAELIDTFPDAVPAARRAAKGMLRELKKSVSSLSDFRELCDKHVQSAHFKRQPELIAYYDGLINRLLQNYEKEIKKYQWQLSYLDNLRSPKTTDDKRDAITPQRIERARGVPIDSLIEIRRSQALCIFHDDHKPSLKYYPKDNRVYCFACARGEDAIGVFMHLNRCDFKEAVRRMAV